MPKKSLLIAIGLFLTACSTLSTPTPTDSGVEGQALIGPVCPVVRVGEDCADKPYQAVITVNSLNGRKIAQVQTDEQGYFHVPLAPGDYTLHPESPDGMSLPFAKEENFTVYPDQFTTIIVLYESGIR
jgi:hypothetical protein